MCEVLRDDDDDNDDDDNDNEKDTKQTTHENDERPRPPPLTMWLPMRAGKGPTTTDRRPHAVGPHVDVESPGQAEERGREGRPCFSGQAASVDMGGATVHR